MKALLVSPHLDDAILSAGQFLSAYPWCDVMTIFAGVPNKRIETDYDIKLGFSSSREAVYARRLEDIKATSLLQAGHIHCNFLDSQYGTVYSSAEITRAIESACTETEYNIVLGPLGVAHPDHKLVRDALLLADILPPKYLWEDIPNRVLFPEQVANLSTGLELEFIGIGPIEKKMMAVMEYKSQIGSGDLDPKLLFVPERFWKVK